MLGRQSTLPFELIERVSEEAFARHPIWAHYEPEVDRERLLTEGISADLLDAAEERFLACGLVPLYPAKETHSDLVMAAHFDTASGLTLQGYLIEPLAFGIFHEGKEYSFNRSLMDFSAREAQRLAEALGSEVGDLFPLRAQVDPRIKAPELSAAREISGF